MVKSTFNQPGPHTLDQDDLMSAVIVRQESVKLPTYRPLPPDRCPMFLERRVYQGSSGRVYPLPFYGRIAGEPEPVAWDAVYLENEYLEVMLLPQLGGRVHAITDKTSGRELVYRQPVIKPALVGLAGPWISGGIEFNWPQHHRPGTFMPTEIAIEHHSDGAITVWMSDHEPMNRMKGMHGICLRPGSATVELHARLHNRTELSQTFLWWANVAVEVHEHYQSFFPPDVRYVADHAKRAITAFPLADRHYYGVDYAGRAERGVDEREAPAQFVPDPTRCAANDLSWYANIPVPTSYMITDTKHDFFGGYDHAAGLGLVHVAGRHVAPGKKQWTWGNHDFGYAWDRNLTDPDERGVYRPYIELMAGVFTDNQPDFSFLVPGETRTFCQRWYPIRDIGTPQMANEDAALSLDASLAPDGSTHLRIGINTTAERPGATLRLFVGDQTAGSWKHDVRPDEAWMIETEVAGSLDQIDIELRLEDGGGQTLLGYRPKVDDQPGSQNPPAAATEPPAPAEIGATDELYFTGLHLEQYRHATRDPVDYWQEALRRDPGDARCHMAMGLGHYRRGEYRRAVEHLESAVKRLTKRNPNPRDGETHYVLGLALRRLGRLEDAGDAFHKATWNAAEQLAAYFALAQLAAGRGDWDAVLDHTQAALRRNADSTRACNLRALALRKLGRTEESASLLEQTLQVDPLDPWATHLAGRSFVFDLRVRLDVALEYASAGCDREAIDLLRAAQQPEEHTPPEERGAWPMLHVHLARLHDRQGDTDTARSAREQAEAADGVYCFPAGLDDLDALRAAVEHDAGPRVWSYLGNLLYDSRRYDEAIEAWTNAITRDESLAVAWRNLGVARFNVRGDADGARSAYANARAADPDDARLLFEEDQLRKRLGDEPSRRIETLEAQRHLVEQRDDLCVELATLFNQVDRSADAAQVMASRCFQPWEGGEGLALGQYVRAQLKLGRAALAAGDPEAAVGCFRAALHPPDTMGEARHLLANASDIHRGLGEALAASGRAEQARRHWTLAAEFRGDFQDMSVRPYSELTLDSALALRALDREAEARDLLQGLAAYADELAQTPAKIDYFATSLPTMLLFHDDLQARQSTHAKLMQAQAQFGLGDVDRARDLLEDVLAADPNHPAAADLLAAIKTTASP